MRDRLSFEKLLESVLQTPESLSSAEWHRYRQRAAILITDLAGMTRMTRELGVERVVVLLHVMRKKSFPLLRNHGGVFIKYEADNLFAVFPDPVPALRCALDLQKELAQVTFPFSARLTLCAGIGYGDVLWWGEADIYGEEVNLASKLGEDTAEPNEILLTAAAAHHLRTVIPGIQFIEGPPLFIGDHPYAYFRYEGGVQLPDGIGDINRFGNDRDQKG